MKINTENIDSDIIANSALSRIVISLSLPMLLSSLATSIANVGLPTLTLTFSASFQAVQWVVLAYLLAITTSAISIGRLGDITNKRRLLNAGIGLFTVASIGCALAPGIGVLIAARVLQGLGAATMMTLTLALVGEAVCKEKIGRTMGILGSVSAVGTALGPSVGGMLINEFGWPAMFLVNIPLGLLALFLLSRYLPAPSSLAIDNNGLRKSHACTRRSYTVSVRKPQRRSGSGTNRNRQRLQSPLALPPISPDRVSADIASRSTPSI